MLWLTVARNDLQLGLLEKNRKFNSADLNLSLTNEEYMTRLVLAIPYIFAKYPLLQIIMQIFPRRMPIQQI